MADLNDFYPAGATATAARPAQAPYGAGQGQGISGNFGISGGLNTSGFPTIVGAFALLLVGAWLLHAG